MCIPATGDSVKAVYTILCISSFCGEVGSSLMAIPSDLTQNFAPVTYSMAMMMASAASFLGPSFGGLILDNLKNQRTAWCTLYWTTGLIVILATLNFLRFGSAERQNFDLVDASVTTNKKHDSLISECLE